MAIDCYKIPANGLSNCSSPWGQGCTSSRGFEFASLWNYTQKIQAACPNDTRLFKGSLRTTFANNASLTQEACVAIAGSGWTAYPPFDIWQRLTTWKFPLLQLIFQFPRPPLAFATESFVIFHLVGDPIDTLQSLLTKLSICQRFAKYWQHDVERSSVINFPKSEDWKALAIITDAYAEWEQDHVVADTLRKAL